MTEEPAVLGRKVKEWIGKTPDSVPPTTVALRIFRTWKGICHISKRKIQSGEKWHLEHVIPLWAGGENRESNLRPALVEPHKEKSRRETKIRSKADRIAKKDLGIKKAARRKMQSRGFAPAEKPAKAPLNLPPRKVDVFGRRIEE
ncbi:MAG: hypothetical protein PHR16_16670 [Methylovulum sp.]|nr:hypothetical protein [Methylovulum sp.]